MADGRRPAVLYVSTHHAREWISTEVNRRLLRWYIDQWRANNTSIKNLLKTTELWFVLVHNPDGYQYTFDAERLWRKNLRDNDGDELITSNDGVDPNRNYAEHWNYDDEGSNTQFSSETYRGPSPGSEPETQALVGLMERVPFKFSISYHSFGQLLLYTQGWQVQTPSADDPIYVALTGTDDNPAVVDFNPGVGADLYTTNGEYTDFAHGTMGALAWTPELSEGCVGCGFVFPDNEALIQAEFQKNLDFAVRVARSAPDPDDPVSHAGIDTKEFYLDVADIDPWKSNNPASDLDVDISYGGGAAQPVEVLAKRSLGAVTLNHRISGGAAQTAATGEAPDGERFGEQRLRRLLPLPAR
ncbi:MAG: M14 family metallopeptidase [Gaiellaceae bacterium]